MDAKGSRKPTRDYLALSETAWPLFEVMYSRRSHRKYQPTEPGEPSGLDRVVSLACRARAAEEGSIAVITDPETVTAVKTGAYKGITGKINMWLGRVPVGGFLVLDVPGRDMRAARPLALPHTVMAAEDAVLWLTGQGLGTCWLGGVNAKEVISAAGLGLESAIPSIISIGRPAGSTMALSYAGFSERTMSRRRKPISEIACDGTADVSYRPTSSDSRFETASGGVAELLEVTAGEREAPLPAPAPLDISIEACLEAARIAPSGSNTQAWTFVVIKEERALGLLARACGASGENIGSSRAAIVALSSARGFTTALLDRPFWMIDVPIAMSHITLMAASLGYSPAVALDGIDEKEIVKLVRAPGSTRPVGVIGLK